MAKKTVKLINLTDDFDQLLTIWRTCFPEDADFGETFLRQVAPNTEIVGVFENDILASCAYFIPASFVDGKTRFKAYYVYGVGTLPLYRGKGYARDVLEFAKQSLLCDLLFLYPAKPSLRMFYEKMGYRSVLYRKVQALSPSKADAVCAIKTTPFSVTDYVKKRTAFLLDKNTAYATFDDTVFQTLLEHAEILSFGNGTALCVTDGDTMYLTEVLCDKLPLLSTEQYPLLKNVLAYEAGTEQESGMVLPCTKCAIKHFNQKEKVPFFGTFFAE